MNLPDDQPLSGVLKQWKVSAPVSPRLREAVWRRIARAEAQPEPAFGEGWKSWLAGVFAKRAWAGAYLAVLLAAGLTAGYLRGEARQQRADDELAARYVRALDPSQHPFQ
jgi:hypothetical protein